MDDATWEPILSEEREPAEIPAGAGIFEVDWKGFGGLYDGGLKTAVLPPSLAIRRGIDAGKSSCSYFFQNASVLSSSLLTDISLVFRTGVT